MEIITDPLPFFHLHAILDFKKAYSFASDIKDLFGFEPLIKNCITGVKNNDMVEYTSAGFREIDLYIPMPTLYLPGIEDRLNKILDRYHLNKF